MHGIFGYGRLRKKIAFFWWLITCTLYPRSFGAGASGVRKPRYKKKRNFGAHVERELERERQKCTTQTGFFGNRKMCPDKLTRNYGSEHLSPDFVIFHKVYKSAGEDEFFFRSSESSQISRFN